MTLPIQTKRIHPLVAVAAASVTIFSLVGVAAVTGVLPTSRGEAPQALVQEATTDGLAPSAAKSLATKQNAQPVQKAAPVTTAKSTLPQAQPKPQAQAKAPTPAAAPAPTPAAAPVVAQAPQKPEAQNSPVGIGVGALIGGVLGNQVGSGDGKTLATIAGAIGGGYLGNEVAKNSKP